MKKIFKYFLVIILLFTTAPLVAQAQLDEESIQSFDVQVKINADATLNVSETIVYDFGDLQKHGIYRDILYKYQARGGNYNLRISGISVTDGLGRPLPIAVSEQGDNKRIRIGDADVLVTGEQTYVINYSVRRAINFFDDHDELYWNVTGENWPIPILRVSATLILPQAATPDTLRVACYFGIYGSTEQCNDVVPFSSGISRDRVEFIHDQVLFPNQGFTAVFGFPKGLVTKPSALSGAVDTAADNWILFLPVFAFGLMFYLWYTRGRDPVGRGVVVAQYEAPENLTPAELGTIVDAQAQPKDITAEIVDLAVRGYLKINRVEKRGFLGLGKNSDYELIQLKRPDESLPYFDREIMKRLFESDRVITEVISANEARASQGKVTLSRLKGKFAEDFKEIQKLVYQSVTLKGYYTKNPNKARSVYAGVGAAVIFLGFWSGGIFGSLGIFSFVVSGAIVLVFGLLMPKKTPQGALVHEQILGLKDICPWRKRTGWIFTTRPNARPKDSKNFCLMPWLWAWKKSGPSNLKEFTPSSLPGTATRQGPHLTRLS